MEKNKKIGIALDLKDKKILYYLDFHARMPYTKLAKKAGLSKQGAEYKVNNLVRKGVIKGFYPVINVPLLGYHYCRLSFVLQNVDEKKEGEIIDYLVRDDRFFWLFTTQGMYDILTVMWAKSMTEFKEAIADLLGRFGGYIKAKNESITTDVIHYQARYLLHVKETEEIHIKESPVRLEISEQEKGILRLLCEDARMPLVRIAERLKVSAKTVAYAIRKLEKTGIIAGYRPIIDHNVLGYTYYKLWINIHYEHVAETRKLYAYIRENPIVLYVVKGVGLPEDLDVEVMVHSNLELLSFVKDLRNRFPHLISDYRTFMFIDTRKVRYLPF